MQQRFGAVAGDDGAALFDQRAEPVDFRIEQASDMPDGCRRIFRHHRLARGGRAGQEHVEIFVDLVRAGRSQRLAQPFCVVPLGLAPAVENARDFVPSGSLDVGAVDDVAFDVFDAVAGRDAKGRGHLRGGSSAPPAALVQARNWSRLRQASRTTSLKVTSAAFAIAATARGP